jgi:ABC-type amino acid transport substrate-binding protein
LTCTGGQVLNPFNDIIAAVALPKGSPWIEPMTLAILQLRDSGAIDQLQQAWFSDSSAGGINC